MLNLFLANPNIRHCAEQLQSSFWNYRLFFDVPWCADIILSQIQTAQCNGTEKDRVQFDRPLRFPKKILYVSWAGA
ncbi:uncharacterized protein BDW70DRAFT_132917 [Aspergillus foveolatus]|uniref:uncharacterized protein n=1 Tax=Aspergillus foveolatus TaxID=210207 RepID=UPI003CCD25A4